MNQQQLRRSYISLAIPVAAVAAGVATLQVTHPMRILSAQLALSDTGATGGATTVVVKKNGVAIPTSAAISVAQGAASPSVLQSFIGSPSNYPGGEGVIKGDLITVDVTAITTGTAPKLAAVILSVVQTDV